MQIIYILVPMSLFIVFLISIPFGVIFYRDSVKKKGHWLAMTRSLLIRDGAVGAIILGIIFIARGILVVSSGAELRDKVIAFAMLLMGVVVLAAYSKALKKTYKCTEFKKYLFAFVGYYLLVLLSSILGFMDFDSAAFLS